MPTDPIECLRLDTTEVMTLTELALCCAMSPADLSELMDYNALEPLPGSAPDLVFSAHWVAPLRAAARLRTDFDLDLFTMAMLLEKLRQIERLERELQALRALVPAHLRPA
ncbi:MAG: chaperone modulator CbpM [Polaromonas sp.]|nr:chaperone modulator CbpM [Polaromonas sp.]